MKRSLSKPNIRFTYFDLAALLLCAGLFGYLLWAIPRGMDSVDESFYYTIPQRLLQGDRLLAEEWHVSQLSSLAQILPFRLFTAVTGGTEGVVLYMRYVFLAVDFILYWILYFALREKKLPALIAVGAFCAHTFFGMYALNYYNCGLHCAALCAVFLFHDRRERSSPARLILAGLFYGMGVVCQPATAAIWFFLAAAAAIRAIARRRGSALAAGYDFLLNGRTLLLLSAGVAIVAVSMLTGLAVGTGVGDILKTLPELGGDSEYGMTLLGNRANIAYLRQMIRAYGIAPPLALVALCAVCGIYVKKRPQGTLRPLLFVLSALCLLSCYGFMIAYVAADARRVLALMQYHSVPALPFGLICYILCKKKDLRIFGFWLFGALLSLTVDFFSEIVFGYGGILTYFSTAYFVCELIRENRPAPAAEIKNRAKAAAAETTARRQRSLQILAAALACLCLVWDVGYLFVNGSCQFLETANNTGDRTLNAEIDAGPLKGIRTTAAHKEKYDGILSDLDEIKADTDGPVYVMGLCSYCYLYLDRPFAAYTAWYVDADKGSRQARYWELYPEKKPAYVYIPLYHHFSYIPLDEYSERPVIEERLAALRSLCDITVRQGRSGMIVRVDRWL